MRKEKDIPFGTGTSPPILINASNLFNRMKKSKNLLSILLLGASFSLLLNPFSSKAQERQYTISVLTEKYQTESVDTNFLPSSWRSTEFTGERIDLPFDFPMLDTSFRSLRYEYTGRLVFDGQHNYWIDLFTLANFEEASLSNNGKSAAGYRLPTKEDPAFLIQLQNIRFSSHPEQSIDFQLRLYPDGKLSFHHSLQDGNEAVFKQQLGPYSGIFNASSFSPPTYNYIQTLLHSSPLKDTLLHGESNVLRYKLQYNLKDGNKILFSPIQ